MVGQEKWLKQRIDLLQVQLHEWRADLAQERQARDLIVDHYHQKRDSLDLGVDSPEWTNYLVFYNGELYKLADESSSRRVAMKQRHKRETAVLEEQIRQEQLQPKKH